MKLKGHNLIHRVPTFAHIGSSETLEPDYSWCPYLPLSLTGRKIEAKTEGIFSMEPKIQANPEPGLKSERVCMPKKSHNFVQRPSLSNLQYSQLFLAIH